MWGRSVTSLRRSAVMRGAAQSEEDCLEPVEVGRERIGVCGGRPWAGRLTATCRALKDPAGGAHGAQGLTRAILAR